MAAVALKPTSFAGVVRDCTTSLRQAAPQAQWSHWQGDAAADIGSMHAKTSLERGPRVPQPQRPAGAHAEQAGVAPEVRGLDVQVLELQPFRGHGVLALIEGFLGGENERCGALARLRLAHEHQLSQLRLTENARPQFRVYRGDRL